MRLRQEQAHAGKPISRPQPIVGLHGNDREFANLSTAAQPWPVVRDSWPLWEGAGEKPSPSLVDEPACLQNIEHPGG
jgi:hypothetical protein